MNKLSASVLVGMAALSVSAPASIMAQTQPDPGSFSGPAPPPSLPNGIASDYTGGGVHGNWPGATGFWFTVNNNIVVTALGFYDLTGGGLASSHDVGIFLADGTPVVSAVVDAGTTDPYVPGTIGGTRLKTVTPTLLTVGGNYYCIADNLSADQYTYGNGSVTFSPDLNWESYGDLQMNDIFSGVPTMPGGLSGNLDGTFAYTVVPEPVPAAMLGVVLLGASLLRRRQK